MNTTVTLMLVAGAWIGFIWYVKSFSKKYKRTFGDQQQNRVFNDGDHLFDDNGNEVSSINSGDDFYFHPSYSSYSGNIWNNDKQ